MAFEQKKGQYKNSKGIYFQKIPLPVYSTSAADL